MTTEKTFAVAILVQNRWELTKLTLQSILDSNQDPDSYDLFLIDNGSNEFNQGLLKNWTENNNYKNLFCLKYPAPISVAWNLFLSLTAHYPYRTLIDNDIILKGTGSLAFSENAVESAGSNQIPTMGGTNPGAPQSVSVVRGPGAIYGALRRRVVHSHNDSNFLDKASNYMQKYGVGMLSFVPVPPNFLFDTMIKAYAQDRYRGRPFLAGGCVTISKKCLEIVGYYDERLNRNVVLEYSQRVAGLNGNIGYHDSYWVGHNLLGQNPNQAADDEERRIADGIMRKDPRKKPHVDTRWNTIIGDIHKCSLGTKNINLT